MLSAPAVVNGSVYVGSGDGNVYAFTATTGATLWTSTATAVGGPSSPAVVNGMAYVGDSDHKVYALDATTGHPRLELRYGRCRGLVASGRQRDRVCRLRRRQVLRLQRGDGATLWTATGNYVTSSPAVANGMVYLGSDKLYAFGLP